MTTVLIIIICLLVIGGVTGISACRLSSTISQEEEARGYCTILNDRLEVLKGGDTSVVERLSNLIRNTVEIFKVSVVVEGAPIPIVEYRGIILTAIGSYYIKFGSGDGTTSNIAISIVDRFVVEV
jgi:hypothetical protein